jgi:hypothetical protein
MFKPFYNFFVWVFFVICLLLGWVGSLPVLREYFLVGLLEQYVILFDLLFYLF